MAEREVSELVGVYDADGTVLGELRYWVGARLGLAHCALCDITHGLVREREDWRAARAGLPAPFRAIHLDERAADERAASDGRTPCVLARSPAGLRMLLGPDELEACAGDPGRLAAAIARALDG